MLNLWRASTTRAFSLGLSPVCCRFMEYEYPAHLPVFTLWTWPGPPTSSLEESCGTSVGTDLKLRPESVSSEHTLGLCLILDTICNVKLGLNIQITL